MTEIKAAFAIPDAEWEMIRPFLRMKKYRKGEHAVRTGDAFRDVGFVVRGLFRICSVDRKGTERIKAFRAERDFVAPYAEILRGEPARSDIEALEESEVVWVSFDVLDGLAKKSIYWSGVLRDQAEKHFLLKEKREHDFLNLTPEVQYFEFKRDHPRYWERVPKFMVASHLGVTAVALSRITRRSKKD